MAIVVHADPLQAVYMLLEGDMRLTITALNKKGSRLRGVWNLVGRSLEQPLKLP